MTHGKRAGSLIYLLSAVHNEGQTVTVKGLEELSLFGGTVMASQVGEHLDDVPVDYAVVHT